MVEELRKCFGEYREDESSIFTGSDDNAAPPPPTNVGRGAFGDNFDGGHGTPYVAEQDKEDKFRGMKRYVAVRSAELDRLCGIGPPQTKEERDAEKERIIKRIHEARENDVDPEMAEYGERVSDCLLCEIWFSMWDDERAHPLSEAYVKCKMFDLKMCPFREDPAMFAGVANIFNTMSEKYAREAGIDTPEVVTVDEVRVHLMMHDMSNPIRPIKHQLLKAIHLADEAQGACVGVTLDGERVVRPGMMDAHQKQGRYVVELNEKLRTTTELVNAQLEKGPRSARRSSESRAFRIRGGGIGKMKDSTLK